ncbi:MAG: rhodanese-like domain-containing protein [Coxiellaceae bacterium]|nr:rhodanese-like domain-containing protein [Coxiellaceae bacterium]
MPNDSSFFKVEAVSASRISYLNDAALQEFVLNNTFLVVDVREPDEYQKEHISGARNVPASSFSDNQFSVLEDDSKILLHCKSGRRTKLPENVEKFLRLAQGKAVFCMEGGIEQWKRCGFEVLIENTPVFVA